MIAPLFMLLGALLLIACYEAHAWGHRRATRPQEPDYGPAQTWADDLDMSLEARPHHTRKRKPDVKVPTTWDVFPMALRGRPSNDYPFRYLDRDIGKVHANE